MRTAHYAVRGIDNQGNEMFYTGRAGAGWVSADLAEAFKYSQDGARRRALQFDADRVAKIEELETRTAPESLAGFLE